MKPRKLKFDLLTSDSNPHEDEAALRQAIKSYTVQARPFGRCLLLHNCVKPTLSGKYLLLEVEDLVDAIWNAIKEGREGNVN